MTKASAVIRTWAYVRETPNEGLVQVPTPAKRRAYSLGLFRRSVLLANTVQSPVDVNWMATRWKAGPGSSPAWKSRPEDFGVSALGTGHSREFLVLDIEEPGILSGGANLLGLVLGVVTLCAGKRCSNTGHFQILRADYPRISPQPA
jgi:hypothetical protein